MLIRDSQRNLFTNLRLVGQQDILRSLLEFAQIRERDAVEIARAQGINVVLEDGE